MKIVQHLTTKHGPPSREPIRPTYLVLHDTEGYMPGTLAWLADAPAYKDGEPYALASVHYLVCRDGTVYQIGKDTWSTWHAGRTYWVDRAPGVAPNVSGNYDMHGIEIEHVTADQGKTYPVAQLHALDQLILLLYSRHHYRGTVGHKDIAYPRGRKADPQLDVGKYSIQAVRARLGQTEEDDMTPDQVRAIVREMIDVVHAADVVQAAEAKNAAAGILNGPHPANKAASVGLVQVMLARALDQTGVDLSDYELQLVKK
jgi:hypothetical protein